MSSSSKATASEEVQDSNLEEHYEFVKKLLGYDIKFKIAQNLYFPPGKDGATIVVQTSMGLVQVQWQKDEFVRLN